MWMFDNFSLCIHTIKNEVIMAYSIAVIEITVNCMLFYQTYTIANSFP